MENNKIVTLLNDLLTKNYDAEKGYRDAAEKMDLNTLKSYFVEQAEKRYSFGNELKHLVSKYGGIPDEAANETNNFYQTWTAVVDTFTKGGKGIYSECIRIEEAFSTEFSEILMDELIPMDTKQLIRKQKRAIDETLAHLKIMEG